MKRFKGVMNILLIIMLFALSFFAISCDDDKSNNQIERDDIDSELYFRYLFHNDIMLVQADFKSETGRAHGYFYYDKNGKEIAGPFTIAHPYVCGYANGNGRIIDMNGDFVTSDDVVVDSGNQYHEQYIYPMYKKDSEDYIFAIVRYDGRQLSDFIYSSFFIIEDNYLVSCKKSNGDIDFININGEIVSAYKAKGTWTNLYMGDKNYFFILDGMDSDFYLTIFDYDCKVVNTISIPNCNFVTPYEINKDMIGVINASTDGVKGYIININGEKIDTPNNYSFQQVLRDDKNVVLVLQDIDGKRYYYDESFNTIINEEYDNITFKNTSSFSNYLFGEKDNLLYLYDFSGKLLIKEGKEKFTSSLNSKYMVVDLYYEKENENVLYAKCGNMNYYYDYNYDLLFEISDEEKNKYRSFRIIYDEIKDKYYVCYTEIREKEGEYYREYQSYCDIENKELIQHEFLETAYTTSFGVRDIVNGYLVYGENGKTFIYDISKSEEVVVIDGSCKCIFYEDYILFKNDNVFNIYDYDAKKICDFVVQNPYDSEK